MSSVFWWFSNAEVLPRVHEIPVWLCGCFIPLGVQYMLCVTYPTIMSMPFIGRSLMDLYASLKIIHRTM